MMSSPSRDHHKRQKAAPDRYIGCVRRPHRVGQSIVLPHSIYSKVFSPSHGFRRPRGSGQARQYPFARRVPYPLAVAAMPLRPPNRHDAMRRRKILYRWRPIVRHKVATVLLPLLPWLGSARASVCCHSATGTITAVGSVVAGVATKAATASTAQVYVRLMPGLGAAVRLEAEGTRERESAQIEKLTKN